MPCTPGEAMAVIAGATDVDGGQPFGQLITNHHAALERGEAVGQPPLAEAVYIETLTEHGMTIAAGNRTHTKWRLKLVLSGANPVTGTFGAIEVNKDQWFKNVWNFNTALGSAVRSVGGKTLKWPAEF
ncbi:hypothetical protein Mvan_5962 [Mycolicibacterium vanbaalenii PYR-1]|uniref:Uncharacterized protein n=2 Tax=Mycolicibacterium vanbaalenii TaxID=110539 RepID=A1THS0_MYCVP|nr:hypothetical protein Mvan_5962 [Mycolicibacterium vanbaalenii PYR-1]